MAEVVDQRLPCLGIDVVFVENEVAAHVYLDNADLNRRSSIEFLQSRLSLEPMDLVDDSLQLHGAFFYAGCFDGFTRQRCKTRSKKFVGLVAKTSQTFPQEPGPCPLAAPSVPQLPTDPETAHSQRNLDWIENFRTAVCRRGGQEPSSSPAPKTRRWARDWDFRQR